MTRGGFRPGAGRKINSGAYKEETIAKRIPKSLVPFLEKYLQSRKALIANTSLGENIKTLLEFKDTPLELPLFASHVAAGFPSPADDYIEASLDLNQLLIPHPQTTFFVRVSGDSMIGAGIHDGDILVIDRSLEARNKSIIIAAVNGELTVKRLQLKNSIVTLMPENPQFSPLIVTESMGFTIWGVVTSVVRQFSKEIR